jgi:hypothetical protein
VATEVLAAAAKRRHPLHRNLAGMLATLAWALAGGSRSRNQAISAALGPLLLAPKARNGPLSWFLAPVVAPSPVLIVRNWL